MNSISWTDPHLKPPKKDPVWFHILFSLSLRQVKLDQKGIEGRDITDYDQITIEDLDEATIVGEWVIYLGGNARDRMKDDRYPISISTTTEYISAFKCAMHWGRRVTIYGLFCHNIWQKQPYIVTF